MSQPPILSDIQQMSERNPAFSVRFLRHLVDGAKERTASINGEPEVVREPNGFAPAILRVGRRVFIDEEKFFEIIREQNGQSAEAS